jgi:hypothetical protein
MLSSQLGSHPTHAPHHTPSDVSRQILRPNKSKSTNCEGGAAVRFSTTRSSVGRVLICFHGFICRTTSSPILVPVDRFTPDTRPTPYSKRCFTPDLKTQQVEVNQLRLRSWLTSTCWVLRSGVKHRLEYGVGRVSGVNRSKEGV